MGFSLSDLFGGQTGGMLAALGGAAAQNQIIKDVQGAAANDLKSVYGTTNPQPFEGGLIGEISRQSQFKPFTVTTPTGSRATVSQTGTSTMLSPTEQALQERMLGFGSEAFGFLGDPQARAAEQASIIGMLTQDPNQRSTREADIFGRLNAAMQPEQERQRMALEERLLGQGRLGVTTNQYGGTPEQLALEKAIAEQQAGLSISAMDQARQEQALQSQQTLQGLGETRNRLDLLGQLGLNAIPTAYAGQNQLLANLNPQLEASRIGSALQSAGLGLGAQLAESTMESQLGYETLANVLRQQQFQGLFDLLRGEQAGQQSSSSSSNPLSFITDAATAITPLLNRTAAQNASPAGDQANWNDFFNWVNTGGGSS